MERGARPPATTPHRKGTGRRLSPSRSGPVSWWAWRQHDTVDSAPCDGRAHWGRTGKVKGLSIRETSRKRTAQQHRALPLQYRPICHCLPFRGQIYTQIIAFNGSEYTHAGTHVIIVIKHTHIPTNPCYAVSKYVCQLFCPLVQI